MADESGPTPPVQSPRIESLSWGRIEIASHGAFKDVKLYPGGARTWDWSETGTSHSPGIQPADVQELVEKGANVVVLGTGMLGRLGVQEDTLAFLERAGVRVHVTKTKEGTGKYNELRRTESVGALLHSTC